MKRILISTTTHDAHNYIEALHTIGIIPCLSSTMEDAQEYDGLLLPGGGDIAPILFHEKNKGSENVSITEDIIQLLILNRFMEAGKPILGICKGMQLINVALGGTLIQDLPRKGIHEYENGDRYHKTKALFGSTLHKLYGEYFITNSAHHQSVASLGTGLKSTQISYDNIIEGIEHTSLPILGVQWHPERMLHPNSPLSYADGKKIFQHFKTLLHVT